MKEKIDYFQMGYDAYKKGVSFFLPPHDLDVYQLKAWQRGWFAAEQDGMK